ncbi:MAG: flippase-like domain-containing protein [Bacteroidales bacterium]|nr:flippase-like domain-containing protein [Bacteroidales bacterium]
MKKKVILALKILAVIAFYVFLYKISIPHIEQLKEFYQINGFNNIRLNIFAIAIILVVPNWLLESVKWFYALTPIQTITIKTAIIGVLKGIPPSTFTPNRIGETVGRPTVLLPEHRIEGGIATLYSGISQMPIMLILTAVTLYSKPLYCILALIGAAIVTAVFYNPKIFVPLFTKFKRTQKLANKLEFFTRYTTTQQNTLLIISAARYMVYCTQNYLILNALGINIGIIDGYLAIFLIYGIISFVPRPALAELGVRCSVSTLVLSQYSPTPLLPAAASALLWIINILIPCIIGTFLYIKRKKHQKNFAQ